jgi:hypothetical protein
MIKATEARLSAWPNLPCGSAFRHAAYDLPARLDNNRPYVVCQARDWEQGCEIG